MKKLCVSIIVTFICFSAILSVSVSANIDTGFETVELSSEEKKIFLSNVSFNVITTEPVRRPIECFDISDNGLVAVGFSNYESKTILIYSNEGEFLYGYTFDGSGSFGCEWDKENLIVYFVRSDILVSVNSKGEVEQVLGVLNSHRNNSYCNNIVFAKQKHFQETKYLLKNNASVLNIVPSTYSHLIAIDANGVETVVYSTDVKYLGNSLLKFAVILAFAIASLAVVLVRAIAFNKTHTNIPKSE